MIDVTFLLLTFFMLASHFASAEKVDVDLPRPNDNQAVDRRLKDKMIINVLYVVASRPPTLQLGPVTVGSVEDLGEPAQGAGRAEPERPGDPAGRPAAVATREVRRSHGGGRGGQADRTCRW